jgi:hypothetical protein
MLTALNGKADAMLRQNGQNSVPQSQSGLHGGASADALTHHLGGGAADDQKLTRGQMGGLDQLTESDGGRVCNIGIQ